MLSMTGFTYLLNSEPIYLIFFYFGMSANFNKLKAPALEVG